MMGGGCRGTCYGSAVASCSAGGWSLKPIAGDAPYCKPADCNGNGACYVALKFQAQRAYDPRGTIARGFFFALIFCNEVDAPRSGLYSYLQDKLVAKQ